MCGAIPTSSFSICAKMPEPAREEKQELRRLVERLTELGENAKELLFWETVFDELDADDRKDLLENLKQEIERLG